MRADDILKAGAELYAQRNEIYGDNYHRFGHIMALLFPKGLLAANVEGFNRVGIFIQMVSKLTRIAETWDQIDNEAHIDSLNDLIVYTAMLQEIETGLRDLAPPPLGPAPVAGRQVKG